MVVVVVVVVVVTGAAIAFSFFRSVVRLRAVGLLRRPSLVRDVQTAALRCVSLSLEVTFRTVFCRSPVRCRSFPSPQDEGGGSRGCCPSRGNGRVGSVGQQRGSGGTTGFRVGGGNVADTEGTAIRMDIEEEDEKGKGLPERGGGGAPTREGNGELAWVAPGTSERGGILPSLPPPYHWERFFNRKTNGRDGAEGGDEEV